MKAEPNGKAWVQVVYFGINLKFQKWETGDSEIGKEKNSM